MTLRARDDVVSEQPVVSIVTPCFNAASWLPACLESVASQSYPAIEHVVVDAGSLDGTVDLLRQTPGVVWVSEADEGQTHAIEKGFAMATGQVLCWLNADDRLLPGAVGQLVEALTRDRDIGWVYGASIVREGGVERVERPPWPMTVEHLDASNPLPQPGCIFTRWALDQVGGLDRSFDLVMDLDLWYRLIQAAVPSACVEEVVSVIEIHPSTKTRDRTAEEWALEFGRARLKNGRLDAAALDLGRAAAHRAASAGRVPRRVLDRQLTRLHESMSTPERPVPMRAMRASAFAEAAVIEREHFAGLRHLLRREPWRHPVTRRLLLGVPRRRWSRLVQQPNRP